MPTHENRPRDRSVWDIYPKGLVLPWYTGPNSDKGKPFEIPDSMKGVWEFCDGKNGRPNLEDGRFLRGHIIEPSDSPEITGGKLQHTHEVKPTGDYQNLPGTNWQTGGNKTDRALVSSEDNVPPYLNVRFIIKIV